MHPVSPTPTVPDLTILVPCANVGARLDRCISGLRDWCATHPVLRVEVLVIDEASTDDTAARLARLGEDWTALRCIRRATRRGIGDALRAGVAQARGARVLCIDVDLTVLPGAIGHALARLDAGADVAVGTRSMDGSTHTPARRGGVRITGRLYSWLAGSILGLGVSDVTCPSKAFHLDVAQSLFARSRCHGPGIDAEVLKIARLDGMEIEPFPVTWQGAASGTGRLGWSGLRRLRELIATRRRAWIGSYRPRTEAERAPTPRRQRVDGGQCPGGAD